MKQSSWLVAALAAASAACAGDAAAPDNGLSTVVPYPAESFTSVVGARLADSVGVRVLDASDAGVRGVAVHFTVSGGGTISATDAVTDASGLARVQWTLAANPGTNVLEATVPGWSAPVRIAAAGNELEPSLALGGQHSCALTSQGKAWCWGRGAFGALGNGTTDDSPVPTPVAGDLSFRALSAYDSEMCGLEASGLIYCWGYNIDGETGTPAGQPVLTPVRVPGNVRYRTLSVGPHSCAIAVTGSTYCWGSNLSGETGQPPSGYVAGPTLLPGHLTFDSIAVGAEHTCALTYQQTVYCWGLNQLGELGTGDMASSSVPRLVSGGPYTAIYAGTHRSCARGIEVFCWGSDDYQELGTRATSTCVLGQYSHSCQLTPAGVADFETVALHGDVASCGALRGEASCWGTNAFGDLGTPGNDSPIPLPMGVGRVWMTIATGQYHGCAIDNTEQVWCWGWNANGQLGPGTTAASSDVPVLVTGLVLR